MTQSHIYQKLIPCLSEFQYLTFTIRISPSKWFRFFLEHQINLTPKRDKNSDLIIVIIFSSIYLSNIDIFCLSVCLYSIYSLSNESNFKHEVYCLTVPWLRLNYILFSIEVFILFVNSGFSANNLALQFNIQF